MPRGCYELKNLAVLCRNDEEMPQLSESALDYLDTATQCAHTCDGWSILPAQAKIALLKADCLRQLIRYRKKEKAYETIDVDAVWELIELLDNRVVDVYPWRDHYPSGAID